MMTLVSTCAIRESSPRSDIQFQESLCSGSTRFSTFTSYPFLRNSSEVSLYISDLGSEMSMDSPLRIAENNALRTIARDFIVPDAPKMAVCRLSLVSSGKQMSCPFRSPRIIPVAFSGVLTSKTDFISFSLIQSAVP